MGGRPVEGHQLLGERRRSLKDTLLRRGKRAVLDMNESAFSEWVRFCEGHFLSEYPLRNVYSYPSPFFFLNKKTLCFHKRLRDRLSFRTHKNKTRKKKKNLNKTALSSLDFKNIAISLYYTGFKNVFYP